MKPTTRSAWLMGALLATAGSVWVFAALYFGGCRCTDGDVDRCQFKATEYLVGLIVMRCLGGWMLGEKNDGWKYYFPVLVLSPFLVQIAFMIALLSTPTL